MRAIKRLNDKKVRLKNHFLCLELYFQPYPKNELATKEETKTKKKKGLLVMKKRIKYESCWSYFQF